MITLACQNNFNTDILLKKMPVLLAFIRRDYDYKQQTKILDNIAKKHGKKLEIYLFDETSAGLFVKFGIEGSPAFIIFHKGQEKNRMLGKADNDSLSAFVSSSLKNFKT